MNDQGANALQPGSGRFLLMTKGMAAPSPANRRADDQAVEHIARFQTETGSVNGLSGLIKRANPVRHQKTIEPVSFCDFRNLKAAATQARPACNEMRTPTKRHQLTVRVEMELFEKIATLHQTSNKTYQSIQTEALEMYLKTRSDE